MTCNPCDLIRKPDRLAPISLGLMYSLMLLPRSSSFQAAAFTSSPNLHSLSRNRPHRTARDTSRSDATPIQNNRQTYRRIIHPYSCFLYGPSLRKDSATAIHSSADQDNKFDTEINGDSFDTLGEISNNGSKNVDVITTNRLERLGWTSYFSQQLDLFREVTNTGEMLIPVRVTEVHNQGICVVGAGEGGITNDLIPNIPPKLQKQVVTRDSSSNAVAASMASEQPLVGDWILVNERKQIMAILNRRNLLRRRAPGRGQGGRIQKMASNIDTVFVVSSCNQDFNVARLERYVAMVLEAGLESNEAVTPVIVLTKRDQWDDVEEEESLLPYYFAEAQDILTQRQIPVVMLDARGAEPVEKLREWIQAGQTVAFLGSSGVGKSTLVNSLCGDTVAKTGDIHEDSGQGRHTTTRRQLHFLPDSGCAIMDTPGLRELQLIQASSGVAEVFADLVDISRQCAFRDCRHAGEPGCAIEFAILNDEIERERVERWQKLVQEENLNMKIMTEHERRKGASGGDSLPHKKKAKKKTTPKNQQKKNKNYQKRLLQ